MRTAASIDIGTNSVLYSLFEVKGKTLREIYFRRYSPRIGGHLKDRKKPRISKPSYFSLVEIIRQITSHAEKSKAEKILIAATNPLRLAENGREIKRRLEQDTGCAISILSPAREAYLSFVGAVGKLGRDSSRAMIDLGGGSTELVAYRGDKRQSFMSLPEGAVSLTEIFGSESSVPAKNFGDYLAYLSRYDRKIKKFERFIGSGVVVVGGTSSALAYLKDNDLIKKGRNIVLTMENIDLYIRLLAPLNVTCRRRLLEMDKKRAEIIFAGAFWLSYLFKRLGIKKAEATSRGLRHGLVIDRYGL